MAGAPCCACQTVAVLAGAIDILARVGRLIIFHRFLRRYILSVLRDALWMTPERALAYRNILLVAQALAAVFLVASSHGGLDFDNRPLGTDFVSFWTASKIALSDGPGRVYDTTVHLAAQREAFGGTPLNYTAFFYPPLFLLICLPLALLPYGWALIGWLSVTGALLLAALGRLVRGHVLAALAFPAVWLNMAHGQNGFLTAALFAGATWNLEARPILAGVLLGCLSYKPHFLLMVPVVLIVGARWRSAAAAAATAGTMCVLSVALLGTAPWFGFFTNSALAREALERGMVGNYKMQSLFAAIRVFDGSLTVAYMAQALLALAVAAVLAWLCRKAPSRETIGAALAAATLLASPFLLVYDFVLLAVPLLWIWRDARTTGFLPWEKTVLIAGFFMPLISSEAAFWLHFPMAPLVVLAVFASVVRRGMRPISL